ncbi:MAG: hypothetical protein APG08_01146 [Candidatus Methanofastidiosum methylothiophilum]|jgi:uncharacterized membrane protein YkvA (DUF1232 family)|uniref:DUF1232 domain-containing protein n=1 Tax=Candidatus Methanofastidiosum methylothiophilum TaxID=1705564 RepID=A0A150JBN5_9EURY|nr:MAG: hypothetical protein AN188_00921 [Candidatus Methanofastidiosum methylthiophilus]MBP6932465.1 DUF1232 domain-containing protein [Methanofastidiosum sp.]OQC51746.1 MAG: hypothetical protein BWX56_00766 [Euryarchaeota archaeon ADurb.Bin023]KYC56189.1 MAG: hypothetical protein APG08_01146 [Candidatus Methanofastidiosum methylthiophilus]KYC57237.1 MAG: hypothetical protein APG09_01164 [Candidatus Methanofastidiosum methylthiophilus]
MEWYQTVLIAILVISIIAAIVIYIFRKMIFNWIIVTILGLYIASPLDIIPDFLPIIGWSDDIIAFVLMIGFIYRGIKMRIKKNDVKFSKVR